MKSVAHLPPVLLGLALQASAQAPDPGGWLAQLKSPGGQLYFGLELARSEEGHFSATILNASERIAVPSVSFVAPTLTFVFPVYDASITATISADGKQLSGRWRKRSGEERWTELEFSAERSDAGWPIHDPGRPAPEYLAPSRWAMQFASESEPSVLVVERGALGSEATVLTTTGDYRYLSINFLVHDSELGPLHLSCFDGAHAFLLRATEQADGSLSGHFWSSDRWHDTWTAKLDPQARLPDPFGLTRANPEAKLAELKFPGLDGKLRSLDDGDLRDHARIVQVFGSWCPNCNDEAVFLAELDRRYRARGLRIVGLAFEVTGDFQRDAAQVALYQKRYAIEYPLLVAGLSDKGEASKKFPLLDRVRAYPTTIFIGKDGRVRAVHQGYAGPATGREHEKLRQEFERRIEALLAEDSKR